MQKMLDLIMSDKYECEYHKTKYYEYIQNYICVNV